MSDSRGVLVLEDPGNPEGLVFEGRLFGAPVSAELLRSGKDKGYGEVVFNTSMTGYQEILTDPSYFGQMVCMTTPHIGNTGVNTEDPESAHPWCAGFLVHDDTETPSNWRSSGTLDAYLKASGIPALAGLDTRALTRHLRSQGVVRGVLLPWAERAQARQLLAQLPPFEGRDLIGEVSTRQPYSWPKTPSAKAPEARFKVAVLDFGVKWNLLRSLEERGCALEVLPAKTSAQEILSRKPDGLFLSNGPGDPAAAPYAAETVRSLIGKLPIFGVCMGHQILALSMGAKTYKLKFGHRGGNQPVVETETRRVEISSHNHGYAVDGTSLPKEALVTHINLNDRCIEGMRLPAGAMGPHEAFSVQYHPEACPGPHDSAILFERFIENMTRTPGLSAGSRPALNARSGSSGLKATSAETR